MHFFMYMYLNWTGGNSGARPKSRPGGGRLHEDKIKVCVRKRPLSKRESRSGEEDMIQAASTTTLVVSEPKQAVDLTAYTLQVNNTALFIILRNLYRAFFII